MNIAPLAALVSCLLLPTSQGSRPLLVRAETALPATTYASVHFAGLAACRQTGGDLGIIKLVRRLLPELDAKLLPPETSKVAAQVQKAILQIDQQLAQVGMDRATLGAVLRGPMALGISRLTFVHGEVMPSLALVMDVNEAGRAAEGVFQLLLHGIMQAGGEDVEHDQEDVEGHELHLLCGERIGGSIALALTDRYLIISNSPGYARDCIRAATGEIASLVDDVGLQRARARLGEDELLSVYLNTNLLIGWVERFLPYEVDAVTDALGCRDVDGIYLALGAGDGRSKELLHLGIRGVDTGLIRSLLAPASHRVARMCPKNTLLYATVGIDPEGMLDAFDRLVDSLPKALRKQAQAGLRSADRDLEQARQMLSVFGPELTIAVPMISMQGMVPQGLVFLESRNPEQAKAMILGLAQQEGLAIKTASFRGEEIVYTSTMAGPVQITPAMTVYDGMLVLASDMRGLKAAISRGEQNRRNLTSSDSFAATLERSKNATALLNLRLGDNISQIWGMVLPWAEGRLDRQEMIKLSPEILPDEDEMREILSDVLLCLTADDDGIVISGEAPLGLGLLVASLGYGLDWFLSTENIDLSRFMGSISLAEKPAEKKIY